MGGGLVRGLAFRAWYFAYILLFLVAFLFAGAELGWVCGLVRESSWGCGGLYRCRGLLVLGLIGVWGFMLGWLGCIGVYVWLGVVGAGGIRRGFLFWVWMFIIGTHLFE